MRAAVVTGPGETRVLDLDTPTVGPRDTLIAMRACGICGSDAFYIAIGGLREGHTPLGHEPAGVVVEVGSEVSGIAAGDHVVVNPMAAPTGIIGNGGATGALAEYLLIENAQRGIGLEVVPKHVPFEVAALNEPMAVARHGVNKCAPRSGDRFAVFGAGPIGLGATIAFKSMGVDHVVVVDLIPARLEKALKVDTALASAKRGARLGVVAVHKQPVPIDFVNLMSNEVIIVGSMGYPTEIFEATRDIVADWEKYAILVSHTIPFDNLDEALRLASTPGAADKVVVTFT